MDRKTRLLNKLTENPKTAYIPYPDLCAVVDVVVEVEKEEPNQLKDC